MKTIKSVGRCIMFLIAACLATQSASAINKYSNPLDVVVSDPFIFWDATDSCYYMVGSGKTFWRSEDAVNWKEEGTLFATGVNPSDPWANEIVKGNDNKYYLFTCERSTTAGDIGTGVGGLKRQYISVYKSDSMAANSFILHKQELAGIGQSGPEDLIDPHVFKDGSKYHLYYTIGQTSYDDPVDGEDAEIWVQEINSSFNGKIGSAKKLIYPSDANDHIWCEGVHVWKNASTYYLFYSTYCYANENYRIRVVTANSPTSFSNSGKIATPLLMKQNLTGGYLSGPGHSCIFKTKDGSESFLGYHSHVSSTMGTGFRQLSIDRITFPSGVATVTPTRANQDFPSGSDTYFYYWGTSHFNSLPLGDHWKNVFNQDDAKVAVNSGWLEIIPQVPVELTESGVTETYGKNVYLCYTTLSANTNVDYIAKVGLDYDGSSGANMYGGITVWQDARENIQIRLISTNKNVSVVTTVGGIQTETQYTPGTPTLTKYLRIRYNKTTDKFRCDVSGNGTDWNDLVYINNPFLNLPTRQLKAGLVAGTDVYDKDNKAKFDFFSMEQW